MQIYSTEEQNSNDRKEGKTTKTFPGEKSKRGVQPTVNEKI